MTERWTERHMQRHPVESHRAKGERERETEKQYERRTPREIKEGGPEPWKEKTSLAPCH